MIYEQDQIRERILKLMHRESLSQLDFSAKIGKSQPNVSDTMRGKRPLSKTFIDAVSAAFPKLSMDWLIFGEGGMFKGEEAPKEDSSLETRPRLPKTFAEGNIEAFLKGTNRFLCQEKEIVKQFPNYEFTLILKNNRMSPKYERGDELAFRKTSIVEWGNDYLLDTAEGPKFKKIFNDEAHGSVRCVSYNKKEYPEFSVRKDLIYGYYKCVGVLRVL